MRYYIAGFPVSDELYHHGIQGQKWGVRRYQNEDGSYTALGKVRYGIGAAGKAVGNAVSSAAKTVGGGIKKAVGHQTDKVKRKHPWMMTDEELKAQTERVRAENAYLTELSKQKEATTTRGQKLARDILESSAKTMASKATEAAAKKLFADKPEAVRDLEDVLNDSKATASQIKDAYDRFDKQQKLKKAKETEAMNNYRPSDDVLNRVDKMSKQELDNYNAWRSSRYGKQAGSIQNALKDKEKEKRTASESALDKASKQQIHAQVEDRFNRARTEREERTNRLGEIRKTAETNASNRLTAERKREVQQVVENIFRRAAIERADRSDSMKAYRKTAEYNAAKRKALKLAEEGKRISVGSLFYDIDYMDG